MSKCTFYVEKDEKKGKDVCLVKGDRISDELYRNYCRCDDHSCPIYQFYIKNK